MVLGYKEDLILTFYLQSMKSIMVKSEHKSQRSFRYTVEHKTLPGSFRFEYRIKHFFKLWSWY